MATRRQRMPGPERREQLLDLALAVVAGDGAHALTIDRVAREAGVARTVVYAHFGSLDELIDALISRSEQRAVERVAALVPAAIGGSLSGADVDRLLLDGLEGLFAELGRDPAMWRVIFMAPEGLPPRFAARLGAGRDLVAALLRPVVARGLERRGLTALDPEITTRLLQAVVRESVRLHLHDPAAYPSARLLDQLRIYLTALRPPASDVQTRTNDHAT
ncbi:TetR/AcrR family transcriptional regulator [Patulibacter defluvii]|uniref:TetR/AcrR family transcriptional regulator n=1 Tax=Patulibacter defluvii TaxID=3095358 RepID=UPI002A757BF5|nr:TetR/AcrR family transcriptional regulator [Patulibacter sp. DM4]